MQKQLEVAVVKLCEKWPLEFAYCGLPITFFEKDGLCKKPDYNCEYHRKYPKSDDCSCTKKPYTPNSELIKA